MRTLSLSLSHTHTHTHTHSRNHTHTPLSSSLTASNHAISASIMHLNGYMYAQHFTPAFMIFAAAHTHTHTPLPWLLPFMWLMQACAMYLLYVCTIWTNCWIQPFNSLHTHTHTTHTHTHKHTHTGDPGRVSRPPVCAEKNEEAVFLLCVWRDYLAGWDRLSKYADMYTFIKGQINTL